MFSFFLTSTPFFCYTINFSKIKIPTFTLQKKTFLTDFHCTRASIFVNIEFMNNWVLPNSRYRGMKVHSRLAKTRAISRIAMQEKFLDWFTFREWNRNFKSHDWKGTSEISFDFFLWRYFGPRLQWDWVQYLTSLTIFNGAQYFHHKHHIESSSL